MEGQGYANLRFWLLFGLVFLFSGFMAYVNLGEFANVSFFSQESNYPFGREGPNPWYYKTAKLYVEVNLVFGLAFLAVSITTVQAVVRKDKRKLTAVLFSMIFLTVLMYANGWVE